MKAAPEFAVVYDLSDDGERLRVSRLLLGYGFRAQKSVFECRLSRGGYRSLVAALHALKLKSGSVKMYRVYSGAASTVVGLPMPQPDAQAIYAF